MIRIFLLIPLLLCSSLWAYPNACPHLAPALRAVYRFPEGRELIAKVEKGGPLTIYCAPFNSNSSAMWISDDRAIVINTNQRHTFGETIRSIFFELHNANTDPSFMDLDHLAENGRISKAEYVEAIERIEHQNAYNTSRLIERAIHMGYFPSDSWWPIPADFQTHYRVQKAAGHSGNIAAIYDRLSSSNYYVCR